MSSHSGGALGVDTVPFPPQFQTRFAHASNDLAWLRTAGSFRSHADNYVDAAAYRTTKCVGCGSVRGSGRSRHLTVHETSTK